MNIRSAIGAAALLTGLLLGLPATAGNTFGIEIDSPTFCMGQNDLGQCVTYFGSKDSCANLEPCNNAQITRYVAPVLKRDLHYCYGLNKFDQCVLYLGSKQSCENVAPCTFEFQLQQQ